MPGGGPLPEPAAVDDLLAAVQADSHVVGRPRILGVVLEARPLEVLDDVGLAVDRADLDELLAGGVAEDRQPAVLLPVGEEGAAEVVAGLREVGAVGQRRRGRVGRAMDPECLDIP